MTASFFHCSGTPLAPGSIIEPGNWGRMLHLYEAIPGSGLPTNVFREALLEQARLIYKEKAPSRLSSLYCCATLAEAVSFRDRFQRSNLIYEVEPAAEVYKHHIGDYQLANADYPARYFQAMLDQPRRYWTDPPSEDSREILLDCSVRVLRVANRP